MTTLGTLKETKMSNPHLVYTHSETPSLFLPEVSPFGSELTWENRAEPTISLVNFSYRCLTGRQNHSELNKGSGITQSLEGWSGYKVWTLCGRDGQLVERRKSNTFHFYSSPSFTSSKWLNGVLYRKKYYLARIIMVKIGVGMFMMF